MNPLGHWRSRERLKSGVWMLVLAGLVWQAALGGTWRPSLFMSEGAAVS